MEETPNPIIICVLDELYPMKLRCNVPFWKASYKLSVSTQNDPFLFHDSHFSDNNFLPVSYSLFIIFWNVFVVKTALSIAFNQGT
jgi:hypothetical protein